MLRVVMLAVIDLSVIMLSVVAPFNPYLHSTRICGKLARLGEQKKYYCLTKAARLPQARYSVDAAEDTVELMPFWSHIETLLWVHHFFYSVTGFPITRPVGT